MVNVNSGNLFFFHVLSSSLKNGVKSFYYAHCPERAIPGKTLFEMVNNHRLIGCINEDSIKKVKKIYDSFVKGKIYVTNPETAEFPTSVKSPPSKEAAAAPNRELPAAAPKGAPIPQLVTPAASPPVIAPAPLAADTIIFYFGVRKRPNGSYKFTGLFRT